LELAMTQTVTRFLAAAAAVAAAAAGPGQMAVQNLLLQPEERLGYVTLREHLYSLPQLLLLLLLLPALGRVGAWTIVPLALAQEQQ